MASIDLSLSARNPRNLNAKDTVRGDKDGFRFMAGNTDKCNKLLIELTDFVIYNTDNAYSPNGLIAVKNAEPIGKNSQAIVKRLLIYVISRL